MSSLNTAIDIFQQEESEDLIAIRQASVWASQYLSRNVTPSNISYLIQYGRINRYSENGATLVSKAELTRYYDGFHGKRETNWKKKLGDDLNWRLSFDFLKEKDTTKHVHRLHPYKGKFIPQLVEYFLDGHTDEFKKETFFQPGDVVLDPFCGSGTTLVQANELGMHAVGIDVSAFNSLISNAKVSKHNLEKLQREIERINASFQRRVARSTNMAFEQELLDKLNVFNSNYFPSPDFKRKVRAGEINEKVYCLNKEKEFVPVFDKLVKKYNIQIEQKRNKRFMEKWFLKPVRDEINFLFQQIQDVKDKETKALLGIILSRTVRSCRATTHADLATLKDPVTKTYYCRKHGKICKPLFSVLSWWNRYTEDTVNRLKTFGELSTKTSQVCLQGDSRKLNLTAALSKRRKKLAEHVKKQGINGIFTSPPYVGLIDYHEQHAYAYDLFGFDRNDEFEIGPLSKGQGAEARRSYVESIVDVLRNCKKYLVDDFNVFIVANDKYNLYPSIVELADMEIVNRYKRPVLNRTEKDKAAYSEIIFHLKG